MDSSVVALIFVSVFVGLALLYCVFRVFGGRIVDLFACNLCRGPLCDCWGVGGRADPRDFKIVGGPDYSGYPPQFLPPMSRLGRQQPPIVIVNRTDGSSSSETSNSDDEEEKEGGGGRAPQRSTRRPPRRKERQERPPSVYSRRGDEFDYLRQQNDPDSGGVTVV